ncbi:MAG: hypothetical protein ACOZCL_08470 [Bacillota bacterium]
MSLPKSVVKIKKNRVELISNVDKIKYTIRELIARANYDVAKYLIRMMKQVAKKSPSMKRLPMNRFRSIFQYWVRKKENDLQIGIKANTWYGVLQELGAKNQPKRSILRNTTLSNIDNIRRIQGAYLSAIEDENKALRLIDENGKSLYEEEGQDG